MNSPLTAMDDFLGRTLSRYRRRNYWDRFMREPRTHGRDATLDDIPDTLQGIRKPVRVIWIGPPRTAVSPDLCEEFPVAYGMTGTAMLMPDVPFAYPPDAPQRVAFMPDGCKGYVCVRPLDGELYLPDNPL